MNTRSASSHGRCKRALAGWLWLVVVVLSASLPFRAQAETRALLIGVSGYPAFPDRLRLRGPANDVQLLRSVLRQRGVPMTRIELLADGVAGAGAPTREGILAALERLRVAVLPGDTVLVLLAGHGSRQAPDVDTPSDGIGPDGWVKTFLPLDAGRWSGGTMSVERALPGYLLRRAVDAITARGANFFLLVDACHSAALVRGGDEGLRWRSGSGPWSPRLATVAAARDAPRLPQPADTLLGDIRLASTGASRGDANPQPGRTALYYAAQADQGTPEVLAQVTDGGAAQVHGLFTLTVAKLLLRAQQRGRDMTYGQLSQQVMNEYATRPAVGVTPLMTGNGLDLPVLGHTPLAVRQWLLEGGPQIELEAGRLDGLTAGSVLALLPTAVAEDSEALGYATAIEVGPHRARLRPQDHAGRPSPDAKALAAAKVARLVSAPASVSLRVALDHSGCSAGCLLRRAVQTLQGDPPPGLALDWVANASQAELILRQAGDRVQVLTASVAGTGVSGVLAEELPPTADAGLAQTLGRRLHAMARVRNLLRIATQLAPADTTVSPFMQIDLQTAGGTRHAWPVGSVPRLRNGDLLHVTLRNPSREQGWDVTLLLLDSAYGIQALYPGVDGESSRLPPGGVKEIKGGLMVRTPPAGIERLLLIAVPQRRLREQTSFAFLTQPPASRPRNALDADFQALFDAVFAPTGQSRDGQIAAPPPTDLVMQVYTADIRP